MQYTPAVCAGSLIFCLCHHLECFLQHKKASKEHCTVLLTFTAIHVAGMALLQAILANCTMIEQQEMRGLSSSWQA